MSVGHRHQATEFHQRQLDGLLSQPWVAHCLARAERDIRVVTDVDMPYVAGSDAELECVFIDRHAYPRILAAGLLPSLIRHEVVEGILERHGWAYIKPPLASHLVATAAEDRENEKRGITRAQADKVYAPLIKADAHEKLKYVPITLNMKPLLETGDKALLRHVGAVMAGCAEDDPAATIAGGPDASKLRKDEVDYGPATGQDHCAVCRGEVTVPPDYPVETPTEYSPHPLCEMFPAIEGAAFNELVQSIKDSTGKQHRMIRKLF
jgi:hypothetical protein